MPYTGYKGYPAEGTRSREYRKEYNRKYSKNYKNVTILFDKRNPSDMLIYDKLNELPKMQKTKFLKSAIKQKLGL